MPRIEGNQKVARSNVCGDVIGIEPPLSSDCGGLDIADCPEANSVKDLGPGAGLAYEGQPARKEVGQSTHGRQVDEVVADAVGKKKRGKARVKQLGSLGRSPAYGSRA